MAKNDERRLVTGAAQTDDVDDTNGTPRARPTAAELVGTPGAVLSRTDFRALGFERRAIDAIFRELDVVVFPGYARPLVRADDYRALLERSTYGHDRVRA